MKTCHVLLQEQLDFLLQVQEAGRNAQQELEHCLRLSDECEILRPFIRVITDALSEVAAHFAAINCHMWSFMILSGLHNLAHCNRSTKSQ